MAVLLALFPPILPPSSIQIVRLGSHMSITELSSELLWCKT